MSIGTNEMPFMPAIWANENGLSLYEITECLELAKEQKADDAELRLMLTTATAFLYTEAMYAIGWPELILGFFDGREDELGGLQMYLDQNNEECARMFTLLKLAAPGLANKTSPDAWMDNMLKAMSIAFAMQEVAVTWYKGLIKEGLSNKSSLMNRILACHAHLCRCLVSFKQCVALHIKTLAERG